MQEPTDQFFDFNRLSLINNISFKVDNRKISSKSLTIEKF